MANDPEGNSSGQQDTKEPLPGGQHIPSVLPAFEHSLQHRISFLVAPVLSPAARALRKGCLELYLVCVLQGGGAEGRFLPPPTQLPLFRVISSLLFLLFNLRVKTTKSNPFYPLLTARLAG